MNTKKAALVTGAVSGIGYACAIRMAKAGFDVAINYYKNLEGASACAKEAVAYGINVNVRTGYSNRWWMQCLGCVQKVM